MVNLTPGMQQYMNIKNAHPDCIILFRMGDFYETFFEDAKTISRELEITLTSRGKGESRAPLAGIPYHAIQPYIAKLVKKGYKVGIVEQTEDPKHAKGLVKRDLVRIITPGTVVESIILEQHKNNYILSLTKEDNKIGISFCDISTGEFLCTEISEKHLINEIKRINPAEIIYPEQLEHSKIIEEIKNNKYTTNNFPDRFYFYEYATETLNAHFNVLNLEGFGIKSKLEINSAGALLNYLKQTQMNALTHINTIKKYQTNNFMSLDASTIKNLELLQNLNNKNENATLLEVIDQTITPMGKRQIKKWITSPLLDKQKIEKRLESVEELKEKIILRQDIIEDLKNVYDIERLIGRVAYGNANPKDIVALGNSLEHIPKIKQHLEQTNTELLRTMSNLPDLSIPQNIIKKSIKDEPSTITREGNMIRENYNSELDELRNLSTDAKTYLAELEEKESEESGIKSLKIKYNKIIGYFIEVTKSNLHLVPEHFIRKQSQLNSERFVTEELKSLESKILGAQERIYELELELFLDVIAQLNEYTTDIQKSANNIATIDCITSFSQISQEKNYTKPIFNTEGIFNLINSRHPVIEAFSNVDFIPNNCNLSNNKRTMIITGPNMAGKSTYLRQVALITLMAQVGCFVPADYANLPITDRVFSRIGAYDDLVNSQSTFMVEMNETANILNNATKNSLVILDEIGRGTSTFDGVSLAWAITEYLNNTIQCKTLFATHYHHLNNMSKKFPEITNHNISVDETEEKIIFLRKIVKGGTDKSYGIQVAKLAGIPEKVIANAKSIMNKIELEDKIAERINSQSIENSKTIQNTITDELDKQSIPLTPQKIDIESQKYSNRNLEKTDNKEQNDKHISIPQNINNNANQPLSNKNSNEKIENLENEISEIKKLLNKLTESKTETKKEETKSQHENLQEFF